MKRKYLKESKISKGVSEYNKYPKPKSPLKESKAKVPLGVRIDLELYKALEKQCRIDHILKPEFVAYAIKLALSKRRRG